MDVEFATGVKILTVRSLSAFWPGLEAMLGDHEAANKTIHSFARIIRTYGFLPEAVCLTHLEHGSRVVQALNGEQYRLGVAIDGYPLRPELLESIFHLYRRTRDPSLLKVALMMVQSIRTSECARARDAIVAQRDSLPLSLQRAFRAATRRCRGC